MFFIKLGKIKKRKMMFIMFNFPGSTNWGQVGTLWFSRSTVNLKDGEMDTIESFLENNNYISTPESYSSSSGPTEMDSATVQATSSKPKPTTVRVKAKGVSRSSRAGLQFPVGRIHRLLKTSSTSTCRVGNLIHFISFVCKSKYFTLWWLSRSNQQSLSVLNKIKKRYEL